MGSQKDHEEHPVVDNNQVMESTPLLGSAIGPAIIEERDPEDTPHNKWTREISFTKDETTWRKEAGIVIKAALPLTITYLLQYSLTVTSIFSIGHVGKVELAGVTMGIMSANMSGFMIFAGLNTGLDTLCSQAYGAGNKKMVGVYLQRMLAFCALLYIAIATTWFFSEPILKAILSDDQVAYLASRYLRVLIFGVPGYACYESGKRYLQAQGVFRASTCVILVCLPLNILMNWLFVWKLGWGFIGAPIAVAITLNLMAFGLFMYAYFVVGNDCWGGFTMSAFSNWSPMFRLAVPGFIMVVAEFFAFQCLTFAASHINTTSLAAESIVHTTIALAFNIPFPFSIAASTRIGNLIGATHDKSARVTAKVSIGIAAILGTSNMLVIASLRHKIPYLFNSDPEVVALAASVLPVCAAFQFFDASAANCNGILRGVGRQKFAGYVQLFSYYTIGIPISMTTAFVFKWGLLGLWSGVAISLVLVTMVELVYIRNMNWEKCIEAALKRNAAG